MLLSDEQQATLVETEEPSLVVWSSLWRSRPDALIRFDRARASFGETALTWTLLVDEPLPEPALLGHLRKRLNVLINANLRFTFGN
ncbi:MAG: hypothetical protein QOD41_1477 [Cryptosporangiaceae bacterium]|nr:hypothetical protein [Cryptosporangiaceae bacterium]